MKFFYFLLPLFLFSHTLLYAQSNALSFDGVDDQVVVTDIDLTSFTIEAWIKTSTTGLNTIVSKGDGNGAGDENFIFQIQNGKLALYIFQGAAGQWVVGNSTIPNNTWCHVAVTFDNVSHINKFYLNGVLDATVGRSASSPNQSNGSTFIGKQGSSCNCNFFSGSLDELRIWNRALCPGELQNNQTCEINGAASGLVANYHFNQGVNGSNNSAINILNDNSGNGFAGALTNFTLSGTTSNWVLGDGVPATSCPAYFPPELDLSGNGTPISTGDNTPSLLDFTDFGNVDISGPAFTRTFTIANTGAGLLSLSGAPRVSVSGTGFTLQTDASATVSALGSTTFIVAFDPSVVGPSVGVITITSDDCDESTYTFSVAGTGISAGCTTGAVPLRVTPEDTTVCAGVNINLNAQPGLVAYWKCNEGAGTVLSDFSGNGNDGALNGFVGWQSSPVFAGSSQALDYAAGGQVLIPYNASYTVPKTGVTFEAWINPSSFNGGGNGFINGDQYLFGMNWPQAANGQKLNLWLVLDGAGYFLFSGGTIPQDTWSHVAATYDGSDVKLYINGALVSSTPETRPIQQSYGTDLWIGQGNAGAGQNFIGGMDEIRIWRVARSQAEIQASMQASVASPSGYSYSWSPATGLSGTTTSNVTANLSANISYTVTVTDGDGCTGNVTRAITVTSAPSITSSTPASRCGPGNVTLTATASSGTLDWYDAPAAGSYLGNGSPFSPTIFTITNFYVEAVDNGCHSPRTAVTATLNGQEIDVLGNSSSITDGFTFPNVIDSTDFGTLSVGASNTNTFTIQNTGSTALTLSGVPAVSISGSSDFTVVTQPATSISSGSSTTFEIRFTPSGTGVETATVTIASDDCDEGSYDFSIKGAGSAAADAINLDGVDDYINVSSFNSLPSGNTDHTVEFWVKNTVGQFGDRWITWFGNVGADQTQVIGYDGATGRLKVNHFSVGNDLSASVASIPVSTWAHVAVVYRSAANANDLYVNGTFIETLQYSQPLSIPANGSFQLGTFNSLNNFAAGIELDEFRFWATARTCHEIQGFMNCELVGNESELIAYYNFNQGTAGGSNASTNVLNDLGSNANNGTLVNIALSGSSSNWVSPGGIIAGTTCGVLIAPEINITGNSVSIPNNQATTSTSDNTDFGSTDIGGSGVAKSFVLENLGNALLGMSGSPVVTVNGPGFSLQSDASSSIAGGDNSSFTILFSPSTAGIYPGTVTISSNDCDEAIYTFAITGKGLSPHGLNFDGTDDYVDVGIVTGADPLALAGSSFTIEAWIKPSLTGDDYQRIVAKSDNAFAANGYDFVVRPIGSLELYVDGVGPVYAIPAASVAANSWSHVAVTGDGTTYKMYVNGTLIAGSQSSYTPIPSVPAPLIIGRWSQSAARHFNGTMDELRIWNVARTNGEISGAMNSELVGNESGLVGYFTFNEGSANGPNTTSNILNGTRPGTLTNFALCGNTSNWVCGAPPLGACSPAAVPTIVLSGNGNSINNGSTTPITINNTDFGNVAQGASLSKTFTIDNQGSGTLNLTGIPMIKILGSTDFTVSAQPSSSSIPGSGSQTFTIDYAPSSQGLTTATVSIGNNDCTQAAFSFDIAGTGNGVVALQEINVRNGVTNVANLDTIFFPLDTVNTSSVKYTITIENTSSVSALNLTGVPPVIIFNGSTYPFDITAISSVIAPLGSTTFTIEFKPMLGGLLFGQIRIPSDDADEGLYQIFLKGIATIVGDINGNGVIDLPGEIAGDINGNGVIDSPAELAGDVNGSGNIDGSEISGDASGNLSITFPDELAGNVDGSTDGSGNATVLAPEMIGDVNGNRVIDNNEISGDLDGNKAINYPAEFAGNTDGSYNGSFVATQTGSEKIGDINGNGVIDYPSEIAGDASGNRLIDFPLEIAGNCDGSINLTGDSATLSVTEFAGDLNCNSTVDPGEVVGDVSGVNNIDGNEIAGDRNGNGVIDPGEITGDVNGNFVIDLPKEKTGDVNGNGIIDNGETTGDINGNKILNTPPEIWGDINGDSILNNLDTLYFFKVVNYYMQGQTPITKEELVVYSAKPDPVENMNYKWRFANNTVFITTADTLQSIKMFATKTSQSDTLYCYLMKEGYAFDTLQLYISININDSTNLGEVVSLSQVCIPANSKNQCSGTYINYFSINTLVSDSSGCQEGGYQDLTASGKITELEMGSVYSAEIHPSSFLTDISGDTLPLFYAVWIDYNNDGDFGGPNEFIKAGDSKDPIAKLINLTIANEKSYQGQRRLRIAMRSTGGFSDADACGIQGIGDNGEMEDYLVKIIPVADLKAPNLISPNGDGMNDFFVVKGLDPLHVNKTIVKIFTSEGNVVFDSGKSSDYDNSWNGKDNSGNLLPKGIYYYIVTQGEGDAYKEIKNFIEIQY